MDSRIKENPGRTFDLALQVACPITGNEDPAVLWSFPQERRDQEVLQTVPKFCFPFDVERVSESQVGQNFTFVLTDIDGKQRFGFCRLTQGCRVCICLLSYLPWFEIYYKLLNTLADYLAKHQENYLNDMLNSLYSLPVPKPFTPVNLSVHSYFIAPDINGLPTIPESRNLTEYFVAVDINNMLQIYASMLHERRVIVTSSKLSTLTACVHGAAAMLFPMYWQHIFISVLPPHLLDYCCAPMPYLVGVHLSLLERVRSRSLEDVVILNVDTNTLESPSDDLQNLPSDVVSSLKSKLKKQSTATGCGVARAFLRAQAALFGSYRDALRYKPGEPITFCEQSFVNHRSSTMRNFLSMAVNLQLFKQFIDGRLAKLNAGRGFTDAFEEEITEGGFCGSNSRSYQQWMHTVKRGSALINTAVTKARSHAKRGILDIKGRLKAMDEEDERLTVCSGSPTSTKSLSPRRLQKMRRHEVNRSPVSMGMVFGLDDDEIETASKISSEDSGEAPPYVEEDSDSSCSLELLEEEARPCGRDGCQMSLLEEILDSLSGSATLEPPGRLSAAKSLDFFRSVEDVGYTALKKFTGSAEVRGVGGAGSSIGGEGGSGGGDCWHRGQDDSAVHGRHLPPSPRRQQQPLQTHTRTVSAPVVTVTPPSEPPAGQDARHPLRHPPRCPSPSLPLSFSYSVPSALPTASAVNHSPPPSLRYRTASDPQVAAEAQGAQGGNSVLRRKVLSKRTVRQYQEKALLQKPSGSGKVRSDSQGSPARDCQTHVQVPWERDVCGEEALGHNQGSGTTEEKGLLEEIDSMCKLSLQMSQVRCKATDES